MRRTLALAIAGVLAGCAQLTSTGDDVGTTVAGLPITEGPSGLRPEVDAVALTVTGSDGSDVDRVAAAAAADVQAYWAEQFPDVFGAGFAPITQLVSYDSAGAARAVCGTSTAGVVNAFYCAGEDTVAWDRGRLLPMLDEAFGPMAIVTVLAHEIGHAVQFRLGAAAGINAATPSIVLEQQADCFTGAFFRWVAEDESPHFQVSTGWGLNQVLATLFFIRDSAGSSFDDEGAHGDAFDRVSAFQFGFTDGPRRCARIDIAEITDRISQQAFSPREQDRGLGRGNLRVDDQQALTDLRTSLEDAFGPTFARTGAALPAMTTRPVDCPGLTPTRPASYCPAADTVALDLDDLVVIGTPPGAGGNGGLGDFAAFAEVTSRYALAVQRAMGLPLDAPATGLRSACLVGAWAATLTESRGAALLLSPGDLDEAVAELLARDSSIAADINGSTVPSGFARVEAFRTGFTSPDAATCTTTYQ